MSNFFFSKALNIVSVALGTTEKRKWDFFHFEYMRICILINFEVMIDLLLTNLFDEKVAIFVIVFPTSIQ